MKKSTRLSTFFLAFLFILLGCSQQGPLWWKGNLHTHSLWSDGDDYPEMVVDWYKSHGYHFLALSDHNVLSTGEKWTNVPEGGDRMQAYGNYLDRFGAEWVVEKQKGDSLFVRLKTLEEFRGLFEEPGQFLLIQGEEITDRFETKPVHVNATNLRELVPPQGGGSVLEVMQNNVNAVLAQRERTGQSMFPHINHPNYGWAVAVEDLIGLQGEKFFEVYNGHPAVHNEGDSLHPSTERMWDIILTERVERGDGVMYGIAVDDAHNYRALDSNHSNPGRGWVMVRARELTPDAIIIAMEAGDFYSSTGVLLEDIRFEDNTISLTIQSQEGVSFKTRFIGTRKGYSPPNEVLTGDEDASVRRIYSKEIGVVLAEVAGASPSYNATGDEIYIRAKIISSKPKANPYQEGEMEAAWTQPVIVNR
ncbi:MAG: histidinol-phosphatase [bacterium]